MHKYLSLLMREYVICTVGAFGTVTAFFSSAFPFMSWAYGLVAGIFTLILCELYREKNTSFPLLLPGLLIPGSRVWFLSGTVWPLHWKSPMHWI